MNNSIRNGSIGLLAGSRPAGHPCSGRTDQGRRQDCPAYKKVQGVSGNLNSIGSDTLNNLMTFWAEGFRKHYPNVNIQIEGKGSSTAPPALIEGTAQLGPMSRPMKKQEIEAFEAKYGLQADRHRRGPRLPWPSTSTRTTPSRSSPCPRSTRSSPRPASAAPPRTSPPGGSSA